MSHLGRPDGAPDPQYSLAPVAQRLGELLGRTGRLRLRHRRRGRRGRGRRAGRRRGRPAGEPAVRPGRDHQGRRGARGVRRPARRPRRRVRLGRLRRRAPQAGERLRARAAAAERGRAADRRRARGARPAHRDPRASRTRSCSAARRSPTSSASSAHLLPRVDSLLIGGGMLFTFLAALGHKVGSSLLEADQIDTVRATSPRPSDSASRSCCRPTSSWRLQVRARTPSTS